MDIRYKTQHGRKTRSVELGPMLLARQQATTDLKGPICECNAYSAVHTAVGRVRLAGLSGFAARILQV